MKLTNTKIEKFILLYTDICGVKFNCFVLQYKKVILIYKTKTTLILQNNHDDINIDELINT